MHTLEMPTTAGSVSKKQGMEQLSPSTHMRSKQEVLAYEFPDLVERIQKEMSLPVAKAHALFKDTLQFLYVCATDQSKRAPFYPPLHIDQCWHTFLLFTREYDAFCRFYFGTFLHHSPVTTTNRAKHKDTPKNLVFPIAREVFGELSDNWKIEAADCPQSCCPSYEDMD